jgi:hypothetical protein
VSFVSLGDSSTNEQQMTAFDYCSQLLKKLTMAVNTLKPALNNLAISAKTGGSSKYYHRV